MRIHKGSGRQFHGSGIKVPEYSFQRIRFKLCALLAESRSGWYGRIQSPEIKHFNLVEDEPCETRKEISFWAGIFLLLLKSESGWTAYCEISETMCSTEEKNRFFDLLMDHDHVLLEKVIYH